MDNRKQLAGWLTGFVLLIVSSLVLADNHWSGAWKAQVDGKAKSAGTIAFKFSFKPDKEGAAADPVTIDITVADKAKKKEVVEMISNNFRGVLGDEKFKTTESGGDEIKVKAKGQTADFVLELTNNTVQGVSIKLKD